MANKKKKPPYALFVLLPLLAIGVVGILRDRNARQSSEDAYALVDKAVQTGESVSPDDVHKRLGRDPDGPISEEGGRLFEKYSWPGGLRSYFVYIAYDQGEPPILRDVYLNEEP